MRRRSTTGRALRTGTWRIASSTSRGGGGNGNGVIDAGDAVYPALRIWVDSNHNGISEPWEVPTLQQAGITRISFDYIESRHQDRYGNQFRS